MGILFSAQSCFLIIILVGFLSVKQAMWGVIIPASVLR